MAITFNDLFEPNRGWRSWEIHEIFAGQSSLTGLYIPNVRDLIYDIDNRQIYRVIDVDNTTGLSITEPWEALPINGATDLDVFLSTGPGTASEGFRAMLDTSVIPFRLSLDDRLYTKSPDATKIKVFRGSNISDTGTIISQYYDQSGTLVGDSLPLVPVTLPDNNNISLKVPKVGASTMALSDGDLVSIVVYGSLNNVLSTSQLVIKNTRFIKSGDAAPQYVIGITIKSPFVSQSDPYVLQYPVNATIDSANLKGVVHYANGSNVEFPIDGTKFTLHGLDDYISTQAGQRVPMVLTYKFSPGETSTDSNIAYNGTITRPYFFESVTANGAYSVKLFGYPKWLDDARGYVMDYWLYNLDRDISIPVNPWVEIASNSAGFNPTLYATAQTFTVTLNLNDVDPLLQSYIHVQPFNVVLNRRGNVQTTPNWTIGFVPGQNPRYGEHAVALMHQLSASVWTMNIGCGRGSQDDWLRDLYFDSLPLFNPQSELAAPEPTHAVVIFKNYAVEITVAQWNATLNVQNDLDQGELLRLHWIKRTSTEDLLLGTSCLPVWLV